MRGGSGRRNLLVFWKKAVCRGASICI